MSHSSSAWQGVFVLLLLCSSGLAQDAAPTGPYLYEGGSFSVTLTFRAYSSFEFDGSGGGDVGNPGWFVVSNLTTGKSESFTYLQSLQLPRVPSGNATSVDEAISGTVTIDAGALGPGPLTFQVKGVNISIPFHPSRSPNGIYGGYVNTTLIPTNVQASLPLDQSKNLSNSPPGRPGSGRTISNTSTNIHAVIISGLSDPAKVINSPNVTLTGGIVALGKDALPLPSASTWSPGLRIVPDYALLTGEKIPPITPNILDVRIVRQQVTADFPSPGPQQSN